MAKQFTGIDGALYADGNKVPRVSAWTFSASAAALPTTTLEISRQPLYTASKLLGTCTIITEKDGGVLMVLR